MIVRVEILISVLCMGCCGDIKGFGVFDWSSDFLILGHFFRSIVVKGFRLNCLFSEDQGELFDDLGDLLKRP